MNIKYVKKWKQFEELLVILLKLYKNIWETNRKLFICFDIYNFFPSLPLILFSFLDSVILYNNLFPPKKMYYKSNLVIWAQPFLLSHPSYYCLGSSNQVIFSDVRKGSPYPLSFTLIYICPGFPQENWVGWGRKGDRGVKEEGF